MSDVQPSARRAVRVGWLVVSVAVIGVGATIAHRWLFGLPGHGHGPDWRVIAVEPVTAMGSAPQLSSSLPGDQFPDGELRPGELAVMFEAGESPCSHVRVRSVSIDELERIDVRLRMVSQRVRGGCDDIGVPVVIAIAVDGDRFGEATTIRFDDASLSTPIERSDSD